MIIGYARTSTVDQVAGLDAQLRDLQAAGCEKIFQEQVSSVARKKRAALDAMIEFAREGDVVVVTKPDRLARSVADLLQIVDALGSKEVGLRILSMGVDTSTPTGRLILTTLGAVAEFERSIMLERQAEGIAKARREGRYRGRAPTARAQAAQVLALRAEGLGVAEIRRRVGVSASSIYRIFRDAGGGAPAKAAE